MSEWRSPFMVYLHPFPALIASFVCPVLKHETGFTDQAWGGSHQSSDRGDFGCHVRTWEEI